MTGLIVRQRMSADVVWAWWARRSKPLLFIALASMSLACVLRFQKEFSLLVFADLDKGGAVDLWILHQMVQDWFAGRPIYDELGFAIYPPASYPLLWPFLGWLEMPAARWLWALTLVVALCGLVYGIVRQTRVSAWPDRALVALMVLAIYPTAVTIGNGQLIVHVLLALLAGLLLLRAEAQSMQKPGWLTDGLAAALFIAALVKPSITAPFFWLLLVMPGRLRPAVLVVGSYLALTLFAAAFQAATLPTLIIEWLQRGAAVSAQQGTANVHIWLGLLGLGAWTLPASLVMFIALGIWTYRNRHADIWILLGVTALVARFWNYHQLYDDLLILLPMVTLFRMARASMDPDYRNVIAGVLLILTLGMMLGPSRLLSYPPPWNWLAEGGQTLVWLAALTFLVTQAGWYSESSFRCS